MRRKAGWENDLALVKMAAIESSGRRSRAKAVKPYASASFLAPAPGVHFSFEICSGGLRCAATTGCYLATLRVAGKNGDNGRTESNYR